MKDFDVIVIGAGIGGMISAGILSNQGMDVLLIEKNPRPGGYVTSFSRKGFVFDAAVDCISGIGRNGLISRVIEFMDIAEEIDFIKVVPIRYSIFPDHSISVFNNLSEYIDELIYLFPGQAKGIEGFFRTAEAIYNESLDVAEMMIEGQDKTRHVSSLLLQAASTTYGVFIDQFIDDFRLKAVLSDRCPFIGLPPSQVSTLAMINLIMSYFMQGAYRTKGGYQRFSNSLVSGMRKMGCKVVLGKRVNRIIIEGHRCKEVCCDDGISYRARYIVSNVDYYTLLKSFSDERYDRLADDSLREIGVSKSFFMVYSGVKDINIEHSSIGYFTSYDMEEFFKEANSFKDSSTLGITVATVEDRERAPVGCHTIVLHEMVEADKTIYDKEQCIMNLLHRVERLFPGLRERIIVLDAATPGTLQRYTGNYNGAAFGWKQVPGFRNIKRHGIKNLYIAGHWGEFGGGVLASAYSGVKVAKEILLHEGVKIEI